MIAYAINERMRRRVESRTSAGKARCVAHQPRGQNGARGHPAGAADRDAASLRKHKACRLAVGWVPTVVFPAREQTCFECDQPHTE
jgi:hypothetical protein